MISNIYRLSFSYGFVAKASVWISRVLILSVILVWSTADAKEMTKSELYEFRNKYLHFSPKFKNDINDIFDNYPIHTNIIFPIFLVKDNILDKMFTDLDYTGRVGREYAGSPYYISRVENYFRAQIRDVVDGTIHILKADRVNNQYVYLVKGYYDTFITLRGKMIVEVKYETIGSFIKFDVDAFVIIDNSVLWRIARYFKNSPAFQTQIDHLIAINVRNTIMLGRRTVSGIIRDLKGKKY